MSEKISKDGNRVTITEFECREIDQYGDAQNVDHFDTKAEAIVAAERYIAGGGVAAAVEKHVSRYPMFLCANPSVYKTVATFGSKKALELWGAE